MAAGLLLGIGLWIAYGFWYGFPFLLAGIILTIGYILLGTVQSAALMMNDQNMDAAEERLNLTYFPNLLFSANKAYYFMLRGTIATQKKDYTTAEGFIQQSLETGLPSDNEKAVAYLQLSNIAATRNNWTQVQNYTSLAKKLKVTEPMIAEQVKELTKAVKNRGNRMSPSMMGQRGMMHGGKRRRPKQR